MKTKHLFWGFLFITIGVLFLVNNFTRVDIYWFNLWQYWPIFLIFLGAALLIGKDIIRSILISIIAIILGISIFATFKTSWGFFSNDFDIDFNNGIQISDNNDRDLRTQVFEEKFDANITKAELNFQSGAGKFRIKDTTALLFHAITKTRDHDYSLSRTDDTNKVRIDFHSDRNHFSIFSGKNRNLASIRLNTNPVWKIGIEVGATSSEFDLRKFKVEHLNIETGAAHIKIKLGELIDSAKVDIGAGASSLEISVPENTGCEINSDVVLSNRDYKGFSKISKDLYRTENFNTAGKKIYFDIDTGVSSVKIRRYPADEW